MPNLVFNNDEVEDNGKGIVNEKSGYLYVGRKFAGREVRWIRLKTDK